MTYQMHRIGSHSSRYSEPIEDQVDCILQRLLRELAGALRGLIDAVNGVMVSHNVTAGSFEGGLVYIERIDVIPRHSPKDGGDFSPALDLINRDKRCAMIKCQESAMQPRGDDQLGVRE
jgi:hypothetical protein